MGLDSYNPRKNTRALLLNRRPSFSLSSISTVSRMDFHNYEAFSRKHAETLNSSYSLHTVKTAKICKTNSFQPEKDSSIFTDFHKKYWSRDTIPFRLKILCTLPSQPIAVLFGAAPNLQIFSRKRELTPTPETEKLETS